MSKQYLDNTKEEGVATPEQGSENQVVQGNSNGAHGSSNSDQQAKMQEAAFVANYESALGSFLGPKLYDAVADQITFDKMTGYANQLVESLLKLGASELGKTNPAINDELQKQLVSGISKELEPLVAKMMETETGKKVVESIQGFVGAHPYAVLSTALLAAVGAILADADIPTLKTKFNLGKGFSTNLEANLGSLRNIAIGATKIGLAYQQENLKAAVSVSRSKEGELSGSLSGEIGNKERNLKGNIEIGEQGITAYGLSGLYQLTDNTSLSGNIQGKNPNDIPNMEVQVKTQQGDFTHTGTIRYDGSNNNLTALYSGESEKLKYAASLSGNTNGSLSNLHTGVKYTPQKGDVYSADYQYNFKQGSHELDLLAQKRMGDFSARGHQRFNFDRDQGFRSNTELMGAYHMNNDLSLIGGADINYNQHAGSTAVIPKAGIQYKDVPITLSYDPRTKQTALGITLRF